MSVSVVIATIGRDTLVATVASVLPQLTDEDEIIIVSDGPASEFTREIASQPHCRLLELPDRTFDWGGTPRNHGFTQAKGTILWAVDDDDVALPGALAAIRMIRQPTIFRMSYSGGGSLWGEQRVFCGNVGTPMIAIPATCFTVSWGSRYEGDYDFAAALERDYELEWREEIVALIRPAE